MGKGSGVLDVIKESSEDGLTLNNNDVQYIWDVRPKDSGSGWIETISRGESFSVSKPVLCARLMVFLKKSSGLRAFTWVMGKVNPKFLNCCSCGLATT